jgi:large subunit ribosomal protein L24
LDIKKGDTVVVLSGKYKGKKGKVIRVIPEDDSLIVERVNMVKKHQRPTKEDQQGGIIEKEAPIRRSNVMLICPACSRATRIRKVEGDGTRIRACIRCGQPMDK